MKKLTLLILGLMFTSNLMAFNGDLSVNCKGDLCGIGFKADILRLEYLEGTGHGILNNSVQAIKENKKEFNIALEPDFTILKHSIFKVQVSPLVGVSSKTSDKMYQSKVGAACSQENGHIPESSCTTSATIRESSILTGASLKLDIEPSSQLHFYLKGGAYANGEGYKTQASIGVSFPW